MSKKKLTQALKRGEDILAELRLREFGGPGERALIGAGKLATASGKAAREFAAEDTASLIRKLRADQKLVYGSDDRVDVNQVSDADIQRNVDAVVSLIDIAGIVDNGDGTSLIQTVRFGDAQQLCSSERFANQRTAPFCSGFLVAPNMVATAGHCVDNNNLARTRFVFGYRIDNFVDGTIRLPNAEIFSAEAIVGWNLVSDGADYAVVRLDRPALGKPVVQIRRTGKVPDSQGVYVIGHPSGLPMKYAPDAIVRDNDPVEFFVSNLDTYGGNSGSPVFNADTHMVEGILVRGETDFVSNGTCRVSNVCPTTGCRGEDVTRASEFVEFVPEATEPPESLTLEGRVARLEASIGEMADTIKRIEDQLP